MIWTCCAQSGGPVLSSGLLYRLHVKFHDWILSHLMVPSSGTLGYIHILQLFLLWSGFCNSNHRLWNSAGFFCQVFVLTDLINEDKVCEDAERLYKAWEFLPQSSSLTDNFSSCCSRQVGCWGHFKNKPLPVSNADSGQSIICLSSRSVD